LYFIAYSRPSYAVYSDELQDGCAACSGVLPGEVCYIESAFATSLAPHNIID